MLENFLSEFQEDHWEHPCKLLRGKVRLRRKEVLRKDKVKIVRQLCMACSNFYTVLLE